jgi:hypothetical protein
LIRCRQTNRRAISKSAVPRRFVASSSDRPALRLASRLHHLRLLVVMIDGIHFKDRVDVLALGLDTDGRKDVLSIRKGSTENMRVVPAPMSGLIERGLDADIASRETNSVRNLNARRAMASSALCANPRHKRPVSALEARVRLTTRAERNIASCSIQSRRVPSVQQRTGHHPSRSGRMSPRCDR